MYSLVRMIKINMFVFDFLGLEYRRLCLEEIFIQDNHLCYKYTVLLLEPYLFSSKTSVNAKTKKMFTESYEKAKRFLPDDKLLKYINIKLGCQVIKNIFILKRCIP